MTSLRLYQHSYTHISETEKSEVFMSDKRHHFGMIKTNKHYKLFFGRFAYIEQQLSHILWEQRWIEHPSLVLLLLLCSSNYRYNHQVHHTVWHLYATYKMLM